MNDQSPPKRVTRARAAAKTTDTAAKTTKIATAASKAKVTRSASTTKRKTRADDPPEDEEQPDPEPIIEPEPKTTRGRAKKVVQPEPEMEEEAPALVKTTRGRPKKVAVETPAPEPTRSTRGRAKKVDVPEEESIVVVEEPLKRAARTRAAPKAAPKKTVTFQEPDDKENIVPEVINAKGKPETGLRAKPVRKAAATTTRATRGRAKTLTDEKPERASPLSPKKATQVATAKESISEDELASNEKTPMKPLSKSPMKPPGSIFGTAKKLDFTSSITVNRATTQDLSGSVMGSPARRPPQSPFKESMKASPQRVPLGGSMLQSPFKPSFPAPKSAAANSPFKASLLGSLARRPQSPTKVAENGSPSRSTTSIFNATPKASTFKISRFATPRTLTTSAARPGQMLPPSARAAGNAQTSANDTNSTMTVEPSLSFSGRLSSIMPRDVDPSFTTSESIMEEATEMSSISEIEPIEETMAVNQEPDTIVVEDSMDSQSTTPPVSPPRHSTGAFGLRQEDENPFQESDSEDELASGSPRFSPAPLTGFQNISQGSASSPATPTPFSAMMKTPRTAATQRSARQQKIGFTPLATQLTNWMAASPEKSDSGSDGEKTPQAQQAIAQAEPSPTKSTFFEDEMVVRDELVAAPEPASIESDIIQENFGAVDLDEEDLALAHEADEMSLLEPDEIANHVSEEIFEAEPVVEQIETDAIQEISMPVEPALSEASQEYGDENAIPIDPALLALSAPHPPAQAYATPKRVLSERVFHTVSKVPLKAPADVTPMRPSPMKRSASISRLPVQRPTSNLARSNTVISYSPTKSTPRVTLKEQSPDVVMQDTIATPSKPKMTTWSTMGTPARTPRRDLNTALLKGAVVFVDVHTTEGADASTLFTELLTQMGARCVKRWDWNGNSDEASGSKIGITHVVFKDGGKRTLEKAKETNEVVSCVGVGWVLEFVLPTHPFRHLTNKSQLRERK
jgi:hypothetical protein